MIYFDFYFLPDKILKIIQPIQNPANVLFYLMILFILLASVIKACKFSWSLPAI